MENLSPVRQPAWQFHTGLPWLNHRGCREKDHLKKVAIFLKMEFLKIIVLEEICLYQNLTRSRTDVRLETDGYGFPGDGDGDKGM